LLTFESGDEDEVERVRRSIVVPNVERLINLRLSTVGDNADDIIFSTTRD
jgi:hypothetical protein